MSKEEILDKYESNVYYHNDDREGILKAMEEYAQSQVAEKEKRIAELERDREDCIKEKWEVVNDAEVTLLEKQQEIERLKGLVKEAHYAGWYNGLVNAYKHDFSWEEFKIKNNL